jgi:hypothetical protein
MSTGSAEIDSLIDGVQEGSFYLFYSSHENQLILDSLLYRQLISCILPKNKKKNGFESAAIGGHQVTIAEEIAEEIESDSDIRLLAIRDLTKFIVKDRGTNWNANDDTNTLKKTLGTVYRTCTKNKVAIVATGSCNVANNGFIPKPAGGIYLKHIANVIVHVKPNYWSTTTNGNNASPYVSFKASMIKHQYQRTPKSVSFSAKRIGKRMNPMLYILD